MSEAADLVFPRVISDPVRRVLGLRAGKVHRIACRLRKLGKQVPCEVEEEQAYVLHWLLALALEYGDRWLDVAWNQHLYPGGGQ